LTPSSKSLQERDVSYSTISTIKAGYMEKLKESKSGKTMGVGVPTTVTGAFAKKYFCLNGTVLAWYSDQKESVLIVSFVRLINVLT
jgi:hypothetical protein